MQFIASIGDLKCHEIVQLNVVKLSQDISRTDNFLSKWQESGKVGSQRRSNRQFKIPLLQFDTSTSKIVATLKYQPFLISSS
jgi:hypothetical protein